MQRHPQAAPAQRRKRECSTTKGRGGGTTTQKGRGKQHHTKVSSSLLVWAGLPPPCVGWWCFSLHFGGGAAFSLSFWRGCLLPSLWEVLLSFLPSCCVPPSSF